MVDDVDFDTAEPAPAPVKRPTKGPTVAERAEAAAARANGDKPETTDDAPKAEIIALVERAPADVLKSEEHLAALYAHIEGEIAAFVPNLDTATGRKSVASLAYKITRTKTALDEAGKELNASLRKTIEAVDEVRRGARAKLDELSDLARKPLTDWEEAEKKREAAIANIERMISVRIDPLATSGDLAGIIDDLGELEIDPEIIGQERADELTEKRQDVIADLILTKERIRREEEQAAENKRLQDELDARKAEDDARAEQERLREQQEAQRREDDERREQHEQHKRDCATRAGEARGLLSAAEVAHPSQELLDRLHALRTDGALVGPENSSELSHWKETLVRRVEAALTKAADQARELERQAEAQKAVENDEAKRRAMRTAVRNKLLELGEEHEMPKELANKLALAIINGEVPHLAITYETE